jgi:hypothetical protein
MQLKKSEKRMLMLLIPTVIIAAVVMLMPSKKSKVKKAVAATTGKLTQSVAKLTGSVADTRKSAVDTLHFASWGERDPFSKPQYTPYPSKRGDGEGPGLRVKGIVWMQGRPYVLINDQVLGVGEEKRGLRVERIEGKKIICRKGGKMITLTWSGSP